MRPLRTAFALLFVCVALNADVIPEPIDYPKGLTGLPKENTAIAMTEEDLVIRVHEKSTDVSARFVLKNRGKSRSLEVGFPPAGVKDIKVLVDGNAVAVKVKQYPALIGGRPIDPKRLRYSSFPWYTWPMVFASGESHVVLVTYRTDLFGDVPYPPSALPEHDHAWLQRKMRTKSVDYTLHTGAYWKGPIGECNMRVEFEHSLDDRVRGAWPDGWAIEGKALVWKLTDFEPESDMRISWLANNTEKDLYDAILWMAAEHPDNPHMILHAGKTLEKAGHTDERQKLYDAFLVFPSPLGEDRLAAWLEIVHVSLDVYEATNRIEAARVLARRALPAAEWAAMRAENAPHMGKFGRPSPQSAIDFRDRVRKLAEQAPK